MEKRLESDWVSHSNYYSKEDISVFDKLLPELLSEPAKKTTWAKEEHGQMMERFQKSFGGDPLKIEDRE